MDIILHVVHILSALALIGLIMIQQGRGADAGASFGGGASGSQSMFGSTGSANFLSRATAMFAVVFMVTSLGLAWQARQAANALQNQGEKWEQMLNQDFPTIDESAIEEGDFPAVERDFPMESDDFPAIDEDDAANASETESVEVESATAEDTNEE